VNLTVIWRVLSVQVNYYVLLCVRREPLKILGVMVQNIVVRATQYPGFVHPWITPSSESYVIVKYLPVPGI
jgi:hypothetical protein